MRLHSDWWRELICDAALIPLPLDGSGRPDLAAHPVPLHGPRDAWLVIAPAAARLCPGFARILREHECRDPTVDLLYADEVEHAGPGSGDPQLKPELNLALLLSADYVGFPLFVRLATYMELGGLRNAAGSAMVFDLLLRAVRAGAIIGRIPQIMVAHGAARPRASLADRQAIANAWLGGWHEALGAVPGLTPDSLQLRRRFDSFPVVTLVIPTRQALQYDPLAEGPGRPHVANLLDSLVRTDWPMDRLEVLVGDDLPDESGYSALPYPFRLRRIHTPRPADAPFNYAEKMNQLWRNASTELLVLMNDDLVVRDGGWLRALLTYAMEEDVGGVGARLLYGDGRLQHAGIPGGLRGGCAHAWIFSPAAAATYGDWALMQREWSMVTGAVFATRRRVLEEVNGFDERFSLEFNDVDLCLRLRLLGYRIVYTPFAEFVHYEKSSRGNTRPRGDQVALFMQRWESQLGNDPAFHPGFSTLDENIAIRPPDDPWYRRG